MGGDLSGIMGFRLQGTSECVCVHMCEQECIGGMTICMDSSV